MFSSFLHRLVEVASYKISSIISENMSLDSLSTGGTKSYRIEEIPKDELHIAEDEILVSVAHFHKEVFSTFGIPFHCKVKEGERYSDVRERIQKKLDVPDKEFEKVRKYFMLFYLY